MFSMFVLWLIVLVGVFRHARWTLPLGVVSLVWTLVLLRLHMNSGIPLNF